VIAQLVSGVATALALLSIAALLRHLLDGGIAPEQLRAAAPLLLQLLAVLVLQLIADVAARVAKAHVVPKVHQVAETELYRSSLAVDLESFDDPNFYDQLMRARDRGVMHLEGAIDSMVDVGAAAFAVAGAAVALMILHPLLFAILLLALLPEAWTAMASARVQYAGMPITIALSRQVQMMAELATRRECAPEIRANQTERYVLDEYRTQATRLQEHLVALGLREVKLAAIGRVLSGIGLLATFAALLAMLQANWLGLAAAGTAVVAIRSASAEIARLIQALNGLIERALYICDYHDFIAQSQQRSAGDAPDQSLTLPIEGRIEIRDVAFAYPNSSGAPALHGINFSIEPRQTIALVGENGSGKTTLAKLISGLYRPTAGRILVGGVDLATFDRRALAARVAMVLQEPIRWPRSARDNIRLGRYEQHDPDQSRLLDAARQSHALEVIERLPQLWDTLLSKEFRGGRDLSSGQWQRLAVARGLYRDAPLVIWDEPTAPLDARAERAVYDSLRKLSAERTVILITHRLASIRDADRIHFLEHGAIVESGSHAELMALDGRYAELYRLQARMHALEDSD
jgi:ATP-binding cassette, subfamily B, bacterial